MAVTVAHSPHPGDAPQLVERLEALRVAPHAGGRPKRAGAVAIAAGACFLAFGLATLIVAAALVADPCGAFARWLVTAVFAT